MFDEIFRDVNWILLGALICVSALVSWAGDVIGMKLGKKRITLWKLRPKYTSRIISVITGVLIALATIFALCAASEQVRTALFSMQIVQRQLYAAREELKKNQETITTMQYDLFQSRGDLSAKEEELAAVEQKLAAGLASLDDVRKKLADMTALRDKATEEHRVLVEEKAKLSDEIAALSKSAEKQRKELTVLKDNIKRLRSGRIAAFSGEILSQGVITYEHSTERELRSCIDRLRTDARRILAYRFGVASPESMKLPIVLQKSIDETMAILTETPGRWVIRLTAVGNAVEGEPVITKLSTYKSKLIYKANEVLYSHKFDAETDRGHVEHVISSALGSINKKASADGVIRDPITGNVGSIDTEELNSAIKKIASSKSPVRLDIAALKDIYSEGPVYVEMKLQNISGR